MIVGFLLIGCASPGFGYLSKQEIESAVFRGFLTGSGLLLAGAVFCPMVR
jgi:hypothetical protein